MRTTFVANFSGSIRTETRNGKSYLVAPCVLLREGVFRGSHGSVRYTAQSLRNSIRAWNNNVPVTWKHPVDNTGQPISAQEAPDSQILGFLNNVEFSNGSLRGEVWLDMAKLNSQGLHSVAETIRNDRMEVSTGLFPTSTGPGDGQCQLTCLEMEPDHLAIGVDEGACNWSSGCGLPRTNQKGETNMTNNQDYEPGIWNPLGNPEPDTDKHGNEKGIYDPMQPSESDFYPDGSEKGIATPGPENK